MTHLHTNVGLLVALLISAMGSTHHLHARGKAEPALLTARGEQLKVEYAERLETLRSQIAAALPEVDAAKKEAFLQQHAAIVCADATKQGDEPGRPETLLAARALLESLDALLTSDALDRQLVECAILSHATPHRLASFAQKGDAEKALLDKLFADPVLMMRMAYHGGAIDGNYGQAMQLYAEIQARSPEAREDGIFERLALGTALQQAGTRVDRTDAEAYDPMAYFLHYVEAYRNNELDPKFDTIDTWNCRYITERRGTLDEMKWCRAMLRVYRPDHIVMEDYRWRYVRIVKSDLPYCSTRQIPELAKYSRMQQWLASGGICGPRAFFGRLALASFGIPNRAAPQTGHAALSHWTPDGWTKNFGAHWKHGRNGSGGGMDFFIETQARSHPDSFIKSLRAQWIGDALQQPDINARSYGLGGGFWDALAFYEKLRVIEDAEIAAVALAGEDLAEANESAEKDEIVEFTPTDEDRAIVMDDDGVITIPAAACVSPKQTTDKVIYMASWEGGAQLHFARLGRPELVKYRFEAPAAGKYEMTARVATVAIEQSWLVRINRERPVPARLPHTLGFWQVTEPVTIELQEGLNTLSLTCRAPNRGVTIKEFTLTPVR